MCRPGGVRGSPADAAGALPWSPHPPPARAQRRRRLSYFWNLSGQPCVRACDKSGSGRGQPSTSVTPSPRGLPSEARRPLPAACLSPSPGDPGGWWGCGMREQRSLGLTSRFLKPPWAIFPAEVPCRSVLLFPRMPWWYLLCKSVLRRRLSLRAPPGSMGSSRPSVPPASLLLWQLALPAPLRAPWGMCSEAQLFTSFLSTAAFPNCAV